MLIILRESLRLFCEALNSPCWVSLGNSISAIKYLAQIPVSVCVLLRLSLLFFSYFYCADFPLWLAEHETHVDGRMATTTVTASAAVNRQMQCGKMKNSLIRSTTATNYSAHSGLKKTHTHKHIQRITTFIVWHRCSRCCRRCATMTKKNACTHC